ncbi:MAG: aspartate/glutamate racemase family protein [Steroidobacteraceae bacterium]
MTKIVGLIGGITPEATIDYYRRTVAGYRDKHREGRHPAIVITSLDLQYAVQLFATRRYDELADTLMREVARLERAGAAFGAIACNTAHVVFDDIARRSTLPLLSIVDVTCAAAKHRGIRQPALFGTRFLMREPLYRRVFARAGLNVLLPSSADQEIIHAKYMDEIVAGVLKVETRDILITIAKRMRDHDGADGLILGGTEFSPLLSGVEIDGLPLLDTTRLHVEAIVEKLSGVH